MKLLLNSESNCATMKIVKYTKVNRNTIKKVLQNLATQNIDFALKRSLYFVFKKISFLR